MHWWIMAQATTLSEHGPAVHSMVEVHGPPALAMVNEETISLPSTYSNPKHVLMKLE